MTRIVDLSAPIRSSPAELPAPLRTDLQRQDHAGGAAAIHELFGVDPSMLRDGEGWATETFTLLSTHGTTHVDAPRHYNATIEGRPAQAIDELPLEWFVGPGVVLDATGKADGEALTPDDIDAELARIDHELSPGDIVLIRTGRDAHYDDPGYMALGPGVTAEATLRLIDQGIRVMGIDAWGWDAPLYLQAQTALAAAERGEDASGIFWAAHQVDRAYCQLERLCNLGALPATGFEVSCLPLRIVGGSAAPARVVALFR